jgi:hypothetical protein
MFEKKFKVAVGDKIIDCKSYTLREYTELVFSKSGSKSETMKLVYADIIKNNTNAGELNKHESELLLINLTANSEHEEVPELKYTCECGHTHYVKVDVKNAYIDGDDELEAYTFPKFKLGLKWPKLWADDDVGQMIADCIDSIYVANEQISIEDLSDLELNDLYDAITESDIHSIKKILTAPKPVLPVSIKCPECGKRHVHVIKGFKEFLEIL